MTDTFYAEKIEFLAANRIKEEFFNSNDNHAQIVLTSMVRHAKKNVNIYCGNMCTDVSNDKVYLDEIESFLEDRKGSINILLCDYNDNFKQKDIYNLLSKYIPNQVQIKRTKKILLYNNNPIHFTVSDDNAYRLETDITAKMARGNFNDPESVIMLKSHFDSLFNDTSSSLL
jgi:hypothetical protein